MPINGELTRGNYKNYTVYASIFRLGVKEILSLIREVFIDKQNFNMKTYTNQQ